MSRGLSFFFFFFFSFFHPVPLSCCHHVIASRPRIVAVRRVIVSHRHHVVSSSRRFFMSSSLHLFTSSWSRVVITSSRHHVASLHRHGASCPCVTSSSCCHVTSHHITASSCCRGTHTPHVMHARTHARTHGPFGVVPAGDTEASDMFAASGKVRRVVARTLHVMSGQSCGAVRPDIGRSVPVFLCSSLFPLVPCPRMGPFLYIRGDGQQGGMA